MAREQERLRRLEERAAERLGRAQEQRERPSDEDERQALNRGHEEWRQLMLSSGWTDTELDAEEAWATELARRCDEAGHEPWQTIADMCRFVESLGLPISEQREAFDRYPGPGYWGPPGGAVR